MKKLSFSKAARADILEIGNYTKKNWGGGQRDLYIAKLFSAFENLCQTPNLGKPCDDVDVGMRSFRMEKHVIYYFVTEEYLYVAGVLHQNMLPELRF